nr:hypothetical protein [Tanacetum cinerariifolium]
INPRLPNQDFIEPPFDEEMVPFIKDLRCISGKSTGLDRLRPSRAQILWGMFYKKNVDFITLLWEYFMFQADNRDISSARKENMPYPRFLIVIINHFICKDKTISTRNGINLHTIHDDSLLGTLKYVSKTEEYRKYGALIPKQVINQSIKDSKEYKIYLAFATGEATPKKARKFKKIASPSKKLSLVLEEEPAKKSAPAKRDKTPATTDRSKGIDLLPEAALLEDAQLEKVLKRSKRETHSHQVSGSGDGVDSQLKVPDELKGKITGTNEGTGTIPGVLDVPKDQSEIENESWGESGDDSNDDDVTDDDDNDSDDNKSNDDGNNDACDDERNESDDDQNDDDKEEEYVHTPENYESTDEEKEHVDEEECDLIYEELYKDVKIKLNDVEHGEEGKGDAEKTDATHDNPVSSSKSAQAENSMFEVADTEMPQNQGSYMGNTDDQPNVKVAPKHDWLKKPERPPTPDPDWNSRKLVDFRPPQT